MSNDEEIVEEIKLPSNSLITTKSKLNKNNDGDKKIKGDYEEQDFNKLDIDNNMQPSNKPKVDTMILEENNTLILNNEDDIDERNFMLMHRIG